MQNIVSDEIMESVLSDKFKVDPLLFGNEFMDLYSRDISRDMTARQVQEMVEAVFDIKFTDAPIPSFDLPIFLRYEIINNKWMRFFIFLRMKPPLINFVSSIIARKASMKYARYVLYVTKSRK
jgi:hypothetical protein